MKIYTRKGDTGTTALIGGVRVPKSSHRIDAYGTVDELNSHVGLVRDLYPEAHAKEILLGIQNQLFNIGSHLASHPEKSRMKLPEITEEQITLLENEMDSMNETLPALTHFVLPGGHPTTSQCHIARTVCRRAERLIVKLAEEEQVEPIVIKYINRLSDYLFVLSRAIAHYYNAEEIKWNA
jgi:cob(I)alamin adenosyltransferase